MSRRRPIGWRRFVGLQFSDFTQGAQQIGDLAQKGVGVYEQAKGAMAGPPDLSFIQRMSPAQLEQAMRQIKGGVYKKRSTARETDEDYAVISAFLAANGVQATGDVNRIKEDWDKALAVLASIDSAARLTSGKGSQPAPGVLAGTVKSIFPWAGLAGAYLLRNNPVYRIALPAAGLAIGLARAGAFNGLVKAR